MGLQYDPQTKNLLVAHRDFRIKSVFEDDGIYCFLPRDPDELLFITNTKRIIRAHNFKYGRQMFIRYMRSRDIHPRIFTLKPDDTLTIEEGLNLFLLIGGTCTDGVAEWLQQRTEPGKTYTLRRMLSEMETTPRGDLIIKYFTEPHNWEGCRNVTNEIIPGMEPEVLATEDYI